MELKKINPQLQSALLDAGLSVANELQSETFPLLKSGKDCVIASEEGTGKTTTIAIAVIQQLTAAVEESPRALIVVRDKEKVLALEQIFKEINKNNGLRIFGVHDRGDMEFDKNYISTGIDVLIGTPSRLNEMFTTAGYNVNRLRMFVIDDADLLLKERHEAKLLRLSNSIARTQRVMFTDGISERVEIFADKIMTEPEFYDFTEE